jgi:hypothetical protein
MRLTPPWGWSSVAVAQCSGSPNAGAQGQIQCFGQRNGFCCTRQTGSIATNNPCRLQILGTSWDWPISPVLVARGCRGPNRLVMLGKLPCLPECLPACLRWLPRFRPFLTYTTHHKPKTRAPPQLPVVFLKTPPTLLRHHHPYLARI